MRSLLIFFLHFCCLFNGLTVVYGQITQGECFFPDGATRAPDDVPCYGDGSTPSPCCNKDAFCLDNGLCFGNGALSRGTCTDPWGPECATHCVDGKFLSIQLVKNAVCLWIIQISIVIRLSAAL